MARLVTPGETVEMPRPDCDGEDHAHPSRAMGVVVFTATGGWLGGWEDRFLDSLRRMIRFKTSAKTPIPPVVVAWDRIVVDRVCEHQNYGPLIFHFSHWRFCAPEGMQPSDQTRLLAVDESQDRESVRPRKVAKLGRPSKDPDAAVQVSLFD